MNPRLLARRLLLVAAGAIAPLALLACSADPGGTDGGDVDLAFEQVTFASTCTVEDAPMEGRRVAGRGVDGAAILPEVGASLPPARCST